MRSAPLPMWPRALFYGRRHRRSAGVALQHDDVDIKVNPTAMHCFAQSLASRRRFSSMSRWRRQSTSFRCGPARRIAARSSGRKARHFSSFRSLRPGAGESRAGPPAGYRGRARNGEARASRYGRRLDVLREIKSPVYGILQSTRNPFGARWGRCSDPRRLHDSIVGFRIPIWQCRA